ncbi:MAG: DUF3011 domain-containing protein [Geminicoccaceae bacterium]
MTVRLLAAAVAASTLFGSGIVHAATVTCRSQGGYERCSADTAGGVVLQKELRGDCVEDRSWGYDPGGIWVDRGCSAEFAVGSSDSDGPSVGTAIGVIGVLAALGAAVAIASGDDDDNHNKSNSSSRSSSKREDQAISLCTDYASDIVKDAGGRGARLDRVKRTRQSGDNWVVEAYVEARWPDASSPKKFIECQVAFSGNNRVTRFRHDGLDERPRGGSGGGSIGHGNNDRDWRERAVAACKNEAQRADYKVRDVTNLDQNRHGFTMEMQLERKEHGNRERFRANCEYDTGNRDAQLRHIDRS